MRCRFYDTTGEALPEFFNESPSVLTDREAQHEACGAHVDPMIDSLNQFGSWTLFTTSDEYKRTYVYHSELRRVVQILATEPGFLLHEAAEDGYVTQSRCPWL